MEVFNISKKSLGSITIQSGAGTPSDYEDNAAFVDFSGTTLYRKRQNYSDWISYKSQNTGFCFLINDSTSINATSSYPVWYSLTGLTWGVSSNTLSLTASTNGIITIQEGQQGNYLYEIGATIKYVASDALIEIGLSKNNAAPIVGNHSSNFINTNRNNNNISVSGQINLNVGDNIRILASRVGSTGTFIIRHATLLLQK